MSTRPRDLTRQRLLLVFAVLATLGLPGADCNPPQAPAAETVLTILAKPVGSGFAFPDEAAIEAEIQPVQDFFLEASYQKVLLRGADEPDKASDRIGPIEIPGTVVCGLEDFYADAVIQSLGDSSVDFTRYDHVVVVAPDPGCSTNGLDFPPTLFSFGGQSVLVDYVFINAGSLYYGGSASFGAGLVVHELGHQFSLGHAGGLFCPPGIIALAGCDEGEYLDLIDTMGAALFFGHFNAVQKEQLGWLDPSEVVEVTSSGQYLIGAFEEPTSYKALKLRRQNDSWLYIEYRTPRGFDDIGLAGFTDGAVFHVTRPGPPFSDSYLLRGPSGGYAVKPGEVMDDVRGHRIEVLSQTPEGILLDVQVAPLVEGVPPSVSASRSAGSGPGLLKATITASDASGIARVELYSKQRGVGNFDWTTLTLRGEVDAPAGVVELEIAAAEAQDVLEAVAYDGEGNVARREF